jgi:heme exporter protein B
MFNSGLSHLIKKEFLIEFRQKSTLAGILVYIISTVFVSALCFKKIINPTVWNALFWVIFLFITINVSSKSFLQETKGKALFNYMYYHPRDFILSKIIYNMILMAVLSFITFFFYSWFVGSLVQDLGMYSLCLLFSSTAFSGDLMVAITFQPRFWNNIAVSLPIPEEAPVINTVFGI